LGEEEARALNRLFRAIIRGRVKSVNSQ
jgi:hypothetical protein